jgi:endoglucanase
MNAWASTVSAVVSTIRWSTNYNYGHIILLPGTQYTSLGAFETDSIPYLGGIRNPDGSITNLIFDVHQYLDNGGAGQNSECVTNGVGNIQYFGQWLRNNGRQAYVCL